MRNLGSTRRTSAFVIMIMTMAELSLQRSMTIIITVWPVPHTKQHPANNVSTRDTLSMLYLLVTSSLLGKGICILSAIMKA